ncbi:hypothetical protein L6452_40568 [Arctium lappa]|uniref:Uncharacterized protein n=1 Tax=Arctium lappa TaxID=4217 RepID=A0ACB8XN46_ARCLA|nr:hypothetical protein L6452_40568 [Arctium lappa]
MIRTDRPTDRPTDMCSLRLFCLLVVTLCGMLVKICSLFVNYLQSTSVLYIGKLRPKLLGGCQEAVEEEARPSTTIQF